MKLSTLIYNKINIKLILIVGVCFILCLINWFCISVTPFIIGKFIDFLVSNKKDISFYFISLLFILLIFDVITSFISNITMTSLTTKVSFFICFNVLHHLKRVNLNFFFRKSSAEINQQINVDSNIISNFVIQVIFRSVGSFLTFILAIFFTFKINVNLACIIIGFIPIYIVFYSLFRKKLFTTGYKYKQTETKLFSEINHQLDNIKIIKLNGWYNKLDYKIKASFKNFYSSTMKYSVFAYLYNSIDKITSSIISIIILVYGGYLLINNQLTVGGLTVISSYVAMINSSVSYYFNLFKNSQDVLVSKKRLENLLLLDKEMNNRLLINNIETISIENLSFKYESSGPIINDVTLEFDIGKIYIIQGENGTGKSTFLDIILGLHKDFTGFVKYNGNNIKDIDLYSLRENVVAIVEQEPMLITDSIKNNLIIGLKGEIEDSTILTACKRIGLESFINSLPSGLNYEINPNSTNLSGGQKQKISLVRAILKNPNLIILDEPTSALDTNSIDKLKEYLIDIKENKIIIIVTHDKGMLDIADEVISMDNPKFKYQFEYELV